MKTHKFLKLCLLLFSWILVGISISCSKNDSEILPNSTNETIAVTSISLDQTTLSLKVDSNNTLIATVSPVNATNKTVTWSSSDTSKVNVANGKVTAVSVGSATITATSGTLSAICVVTVVANTPSSSTEVGVVINGVKWATRNVDKPGTFATKAETAGMFYQWNSNVGWPATGAIGSISATDGSTLWKTSWTGQNSSNWSTPNDPCPTGWRVPTQTELSSLLDQFNVTSTWTTLNGVYGRKFTDTNTGNSIFFPASGYRCNNGGGKLTDAGVSAYYWASTVNSSSTAYAMGFNSSNAGYLNNVRSYGHNIRPVAK